MAIDTPAKRKSCIGLAAPWGRTGVIPDGADLAASQRPHPALLYLGIISGGPVVPPPDLPLFLDSVDIRYTHVDGVNYTYTHTDAVDY